ncbi:holocytochrome c synthase [Blyttiomyces sp. JEL0837]|nr:holocytochrome c synthase [Blyttiomyces sp. JEL0837]
MAKDGKDGCPVDHSSMKRESAPHPLPDHPTGATCPVDHHSSDSNLLNPLNMMPKLSEEMSPGQKMALSKDREVSSIPKSKEDTTQEKHWEYPSPQGFYNALKRKGKEAPEENIPMMVAIHNFLNEACWGEIKKWEKEYHCDCKDVRLIKFRGRPDDLSPKARLMGWLYGTPRPFDRHDWTIDRCGTPVRYVIDYYSAPDEGGSPVFNVDVRPALDSPTAVIDRLRAGVKDLWQSWGWGANTSTSSTSSA